MSATKRLKNATFEYDDDCDALCLIISVYYGEMLDGSRCKTFGIHLNKKQTRALLDFLNAQELGGEKPVLLCHFHDWKEVCEESGGTPTCEYYHGPGTWATCKYGKLHGRAK